MHSRTLGELLSQQPCSVHSQLCQSDTGLHCVISQPIKKHVVILIQCDWLLYPLQSLMGLLIIRAATCKSFIHFLVRDLVYICILLVFVCLSCLGTKLTSAR